MNKRLTDLIPMLREPRVAVRLALGVLLLADLVMAAVVFKPWASSAEDLERQAASLQKQVNERKAALGKARLLAGKIESARTQGDLFMGNYFLSERTASSAVLAELLSTAQKAGIRAKEATYAIDPIEGSDDISMMTINANYEGTFADLMHFLNLVDRSPRLLILESLQAAPQQSGQALNVNLKLDILIREGPPIPGATPPPIETVADETPAAAPHAVAAAAPPSSARARVPVPLSRPALPQVAAPAAGPPGTVIPPARLRRRVPPYRREREGVPE